MRSLGRKRPVDMKKWWVEEFLWWLEPVGDRKWRWRDLIWCPVDTPGLAKWARGPALIYAALVAVWWTMASILGFFTPSIIGHWTLLYVVLWTLVTWGLLKMRPEAAVAGVILFTSWFIIGVMTGERGLIGEALDLGLLAWVLIWVFVHAIRGTFAYQRFARLAADPGSGPPQ